MISFDEAIRLAQERQPSYAVARGWDLGNEWLIGFDFGSPPIPGLQNVLVSKENGSTRFLHPMMYEGVKPSDENRIM